MEMDPSRQSCLYGIKRWMVWLTYHTINITIVSLVNVTMSWVKWYHTTEHMEDDSMVWYGMGILYLWSFLVTFLKMVT